MNYNIPNGPIYTASFVTTALSTGGGHDLFQLTSTSASRVAILDIEVTQPSSAALTQALGLRLFRGTTGVGGGAAVTPVHINGHSTQAAVTGVTANSSTVVSSTSAVLLHAAAMDTTGKWRYTPIRPPTLNNTGQKLHLVTTTPQVATGALHVTVTMAEIGRPAST